MRKPIELIVAKTVRKENLKKELEYRERLLWEFGDDDGQDTSYLHSRVRINKTLGPANKD